MSSLSLAAALHIAHVVLLVVPAIHMGGHLASLLHIAHVLFLVGPGIHMGGLPPSLGRETQLTLQSHPWHRQQLARSGVSRHRTVVQVS